jgi:heat shock protein HslJ
MACAEVERMVQEQRYFELLSQVVSYQLVAGNLQLLNAQGRPLLIFTAAK